MLAVKWRKGWRCFTLDAVGRFARTVSSPGFLAYTRCLNLGWVGFVTGKRLPRCFYVGKRNRGFLRDGMTDLCVVSGPWWAGDTTHKESLFCVELEGST